ncbi:unnamed protein product [Peniophora sp. CBMAI 1063]|nr:unnamed protein product [Peniophora sp. CBMAI 1063]
MSRTAPISGVAPLLRQVLFKTPSALTSSSPQSEWTRHKPPWDTAVRWRATLYLFGAIYSLGHSPRRCAAVLFFPAQWNPALGVDMHLPGRAPRYHPKVLRNATIVAGHASSLLEELFGRLGLRIGNCALDCVLEGPYGAQTLAGWLPKFKIV